jgi:hypothetical protein
MNRGVCGCVNDGGHHHIFLLIIKYHCELAKKLFNSTTPNKYVFHIVLLQCRHALSFSTANKPS